jgi:hypothetical protein
MTDRDDLSDLKAAMAAATPSPDAARRVQNISQAAAIFGDLNRKQTPSGGIWSRLGLAHIGGTWAGLATGLTAVIAIGVLVLPPRPDQPAPVSLSAPAEVAPQAEVSSSLSETASAPMAAEPMLAPQALSDTADMAPATASRSQRTADPVAMVAEALSQGVLPDPASIDRTALINALAGAVPAAASASYAVPWSSETVLRDSGDPNDPRRFGLVPSEERPLATPSEQLTLVIAIAGFAERLATGTEMNGWGFDDALALAEGAATAEFSEVVALIRRAAELDAG